MFTLSRSLSIEESAFLLDCSPEAIHQELHHSLNACDDHYGWNSDRPIRWCVAEADPWLSLQVAQAPDYESLQ
ncbi:hypothetical protein QF021_002845 [Acidovorax delafieldii]|uniref:hypothetical protein n=1 Tax=Acidovorax delafieldii TaxID=47920 RepID=UPI00285BCF7B|nr:hypothetical protein [Acidovorax delafieldii]MDR6154756.1 hypothetical protein [Acidovorax delafieldii]